jgi:hypothetical protein
MSHSQPRLFRTEWGRGLHFPYVPYHGLSTHFTALSAHLCFVAFREKKNAQSRNQPA